MDPDIQEIVTRFKNLDTNLARRIAYHQLLDQLSPDEWRDVKKRVNGRTFQKDILGALPLEIVVQIAQYLSLSDVHVLRLVSRRWCDVLSSDLTCNVVFQKYTGRALSHLNGGFRSQLAQYSKRRIRLEQGNPVGRLQVDLPLTEAHDIYNLDYSNGRYAWPTDNDTAIVVYDLRTRKTQRFCTKNRERFNMIRLSGSMVAAVTIRGYCHAWDLQMDEMHTIRLPNANISLFVVNGFRIAVSFQNLEISDRRDGVVMHYDLESRITHTVQCALNLVYIGLSTFPKYLTMVLLEQGDRTPEEMPKGPHLRVVKYELHSNGDASDILTYTVGFPLPRDWGRLRLRIFDRRCGMGVIYALPAADISGFSGRILPITYDPLTDEICIHMLPDHQIVRMASVDRNILYYIRNDDGKRRIWISNPYAETSLYASRNMDLGLPRDLSHEVSLFVNSNPVLTGDPGLISVVDETGAKVWYFEETPSFVQGRDSSSTD